MDNFWVRESVKDSMNVCKCIISLSIDRGKTPGKPTGNEGENGK